jgi:hypothetical protein
VNANSPFRGPFPLFSAQWQSRFHSVTLSTPGQELATHCRR